MPTVDGNGVPSSRAITCRTASSIAGVTSGLSCRTQARWPYRFTQVVTASESTCSWTPRCRRPDHTSGSDLPSSACHISGGRSPMTTAMPTWLTGLLVASWIARSAGVWPRNSQMSPVLARSTVSSRASVAVGTAVA